VIIAKTYTGYAASRNADDAASQHCVSPRHQTFRSIAACLLALLRTPAHFAGNCPQLPHNDGRKLLKSRSFLKF